MGWMVALWMASALAWVWGLVINAQEDRGQRSCQRRGCRRSPAGIGCNHAAACEGSLARQFTPEEE